MSERFVAQDGTVITYSKGKVDIQKKPVADVLWKPKNGEVYYRVSSYGNVGFSIWDGHNVDLLLLETGSVYQTEAQAKAALEKQNAATKIKRWIAEKNEGWVPDWKDEDQRKWAIISIKQEKFNIDFSFVTKYRDNAYQMKSEEIAHQLLKELPEECNLVFGINS